MILGFQQRVFLSLVVIFFVIEELAAQSIQQISPCSPTLEARVIKEINRIRENYALPKLRINDQLLRSAKARSKELAVLKDLNHNGWDAAIDRVGYPYRRIAENIAYGHRNPSKLVDAWFMSAGHRKNILSRHYKNTGVSCFIDEHQTLWWTQHFGA